MKHYITIQYPYDYIEISLCEQKKILETIKINKFKAIELLIPSIQELLKKYDVSLFSISGIGVNTGPGPLNTLRCILTTMNGLYFSKKVRLIGFNALHLLLLEYNYTPTIALLNAFSDHVYYGIKEKTIITTGSCSISELIAIIKKKEPHIYHLIGNGIILHEDILKEELSNIKIPITLPLFNSMQTLAEETYKTLQHSSIHETYLFPTYLDTPAVK